MRFVRMLVLGVVLAAPVAAGPPEVVGAEAVKSGDTWTIRVTLRHEDTGWEHYANGWAVKAPDGTQLGDRVLAHPHVNEQPFTRSLSGVAIPEDVDHVQIVPRDSVHGEGAAFRLDLE